MEPAHPFNPYEPYFSAELEGEILTLLTKKLGRTPERNELAAYRLHLYVTTEIIYGRVERAIAEEKERAKRPTDDDPSRSGTIDT